MANISTDFYGHYPPSNNGVGAALAAAASGTAAGTITPGGVVVTATPTAVNGNDTAGNFLVVTAATSAGVAANVFFAQPYGVAPRAVIVQVYDQTGTAILPATAQPLGAGLGTGFAIFVSAPAAAAHTCQVFYEVVP